MRLALALATTAVMLFSTVGAAAFDADTTPLSQPNATKVNRASVFPPVRGELTVGCIFGAASGDYSDALDAGAPDIGANYVKRSFELPSKEYTKKKAINEARKKCAKVFAKLKKQYCSSGSPRQFQVQLAAWQPDGKVWFVGPCLTGGKKCTPVKCPVPKVAKKAGSKK